MTKREFIAQLREKLSGLPQTDIEERVIFYGEMIDDRMEEGLSEEEAVSEIGNIDDIVSQTVSDTPITKRAKEKIKSKGKTKTWEIVLLIAGSPIWVSLTIALFAVIFSVYVCLWAVVISLWASFVSFIGGAIMGIGAGIISICYENIHAGIVSLASAITLAGLAILLFFCCKAVTKAIILITKKLSLFTKKCFARKEEA